MMFICPVCECESVKKKNFFGNVLTNSNGNFEVPDEEDYKCPD